MTPTTMGAVGNLASEDVVHLLNEMGVETGIETQAVVAAARDIAALLDITPQSFATAAGTRADIRKSSANNARSHPA